MGAMAAAVCVAGCGVGVGGTGTGEDLTAFGAAATSVCAAPIASALSCSGSGTTVDEGSARRLFVDTESGGRVLMTIDGNQVEFEARCTGLAFNGTWGRSGNGVQRYFGSAVRSRSYHGQTPFPVYLCIRNSITKFLLRSSNPATTSP